MDFLRETISLKKLHLDTGNARHGIFDAEADAIGWMLTDFRAKKKTYKLAKAIADHGLSPIDDILVVPKDDTTDDYTVVEGNRRVTALKLLHDPDLAPSEATKRQYQQLAKNAAVEIPKSIECKVAPGFEESSYWIQLRHGGEQDGIGTIPWGSKELERYNSRIGQRGPNAKSMGVLDYAYENELLNPEQMRSFPVTNLTRLLNDPSVRSRMGIEVTADGIRSTVQETSFRKGLALLLRELADGDVTVTDIIQKDQRREYIEQVMNKAGVDADKKVAQPYDVKGSKSYYANGAAMPKPRGRGRRSTHERKTMIPRNFKLGFSRRGPREVFRELQYISAEDYPNAVAVLFRVFFEGCIDSYAEKAKLPGYKRDDKLRKRSQLVVDDLKQSGRVSRAIAAPVGTFLTSPNDVGSLTTFNSYIHNITHRPHSRDLKTTWDNLAPFFEALDGHL